jgi:thiamine pyrophosphokinase
MRARLVAAAPQPGAAELVALLARKSDFVIAVDGGGAVCQEAGAAPDVVVGDFDSLSSDALLRLASAGARVVTYPVHKDQTDLELALGEARAAGATSVVVTCAAYGRLDHTLAVLGALSAAADLKPELIEPDVHVWVLATAGRKAVQLRGVGATLSLLAMGGQATVSVAGVEWPLAVHPLESGSGLGISNRITAEEGALVSVMRGVVLVLAPTLNGAPGVTGP